MGNVYLGSQWNIFELSNNVFIVFIAVMVMLLEQGLLNMKKTIIHHNSIHN